MMKLNLLNSLKFLAYITPFLLAFTFILLAAINGTPIPALIYFGILAISIFLLSLFVIKTDTPLPTNYNELCKTWGWNFFDDAYYRPSLATYFIVFTFFYTMVPMFINSNVNYWFMAFMLSVFALDTVFNFFINNCYTLPSFITSMITGLIVGIGSAVGINGISPNLTFFGDMKSNKATCGKVSNKNFKCLVYKNGQILKQL